MTTRRILFVDGLWVEKFGIMSLIPHLQQAGWEVEYRLTRNPRRFHRILARFRPHVLAFSATTGTHHRSLEFCRIAKDFDPSIATVMGGPHVTYFPEVVHEPELDAVFRGECDPVFPESLERWLAGEPPGEIANIAVSRGGNLEMGSLATLAEDLDSLPFPDRELLYRYRFFRNAPYKAFIVSRGCPFNCAFCFNHKLREMYRGKGRFVRMRSPESVVEEGLTVKNRWGMKLASFEDDLLTFDVQWLERFATQWKSQVAVPYNINATAQNLAREDTVRILKETGVWCVAFGVETGNQERRSALLNKPVTNETILQAGENLRKHNVRFLTYNMFALPGETLRDARETLRLNRSIGTRMARCTLFEPYPGTQIGDEAAHGHDSEIHYQRRHAESTEYRRIERLQKYAMLGMRSRVGEWLGFQASRWPLDPLHEAVFWATYFNVVRRYMKTGVSHLAELGFRSLTDIV